MFFTMLVGPWDRITEIWVGRTLGEVEIWNRGYRRQKFLSSARRRNLSLKKSRPLNCD
jgi:hypothetical protein